jgi:DNA-binding IclR family transcriptional regulator
LTVLETLGDAEMTLTELSERLREPPTVVFRVLKTLEEGGYIEQEPTTKKYSLGVRLWELGAKAIKRMQLVDTARPVLKWLVQMTKETAALSVSQGVHVVYLDIVEGSEPIRVHAEHGARAPLYATASGKAILAHRADLVRQVVKTGLKGLTPTSITRPSQLRQALDEVRKTGLSVNRGEQRSDISAVAAPIFNGRGECVAAVSVSVPTERFRDNHPETIMRHVRTASDEVSAKLGHHP